MTRRLLLLAAAALVLPAASASADTRLVPVTGARGLAAGGGYVAWSAQASGGRWRLAVRRPDGSVVVPAIRAFDRAPRPSIGREAGAGGALVAIYARDDGDLHELDLKTLRERTVRGVNTKASERAPSLSFGTVTFVRSTGRRRGVFVRSASGSVRRIAGAVARETSTNGSRVAYTKGTGVVVRRISGRGPVFTVRGDGAASSIVLGRYQLTFLTPGGHVWRTPTFGGSGSSEVQAPRRAERALPPTTSAVALLRSRPALYLDADGVEQIDPPLTFSG